jgi:hypothetical protein
MVTPPRSEGEKRGLFATRSPHRPNRIGLTSARLIGVKGFAIEVAGSSISYHDGFVRHIDAIGVVPFYQGRRIQPSRLVCHQHHGCVGGVDSGLYCEVTATGCPAVAGDWRYYLYGIADVERRIEEVYSLSKTSVTR